MRFAEDHHAMMAEIAANSGPLAPTSEHEHSLDKPAGDDLLALIISLQAEIQRVCILIAASSNIATALECRMPGVRARQLVTFYPRESAALLLSAARFLRFFPASPLCPIVAAFEGALSDAKGKTMDFAYAGFAQGSENGLADAWRKACSAGLAVLRALDGAMDAYELTGSALEGSDLETLLKSTAAGGHSLINDIGDLTLPHWAERRKSSRVPIRRPAILILPDRRIPVIIRDISMHGIGLETGPDVAMLPEQQAIIAVSGTLTLDGSVVWANHGRAGIKLNRPLQSDDPRFNFCSALRD